MITRGLFSSVSEHWATPKALYTALDAEFHFNDDPCPLQPTSNGLMRDWGSASFCNPPYGRKIGRWIEKAAQEWGKGKTVVLLIPSRTDTAWWHNWIMQASEIRFLRGRLHFNELGPAPFPSAVVIFRGPGK